MSPRGFSASVNMLSKAPGHGDVHLIPQNIAWLSAMKYAQQSVFV